MAGGGGCVCLIKHEWKSLQLCPTLFDPMNCSLPGSSVHGILQAKILGWVGVPSPGDLPTQGWNPGLLHCRWILYQLSLQGSPAWLLFLSEGETPSHFLPLMGPRLRLTVLHLVSSSDVVPRDHPHFGLRFKEEKENKNNIFRLLLRFPGLWSLPNFKKWESEKKILHLHYFSPTLLKCKIMNASVWTIRLEE